MRRRNFSFASFQQDRPRLSDLERCRPLLLGGGGDPEGVRRPRSLISCAMTQIKNRILAFNRSIKDAAGHSLVFFWVFFYRMARNISKS